MKLTKANLKNFAITGLVAIIAVGIASRYANSTAPGSKVAKAALGG